MILNIIVQFVFLVLSAICWRGDRRAPQIALIVILVLDSFALGFVQGFIACP